MSAFNIIGTRDQWAECWAVYAVHDAVTVAPLHVGCCRFRQIVSMPDCSVARDRPIVMRVIGMYMSRADALRERSTQAVALGIVNKRGRAVRCVETGEVFASAYRCAQSHNIDAAALSRHLRGLAGHKKIHGRSYIFV